MMPNIPINILARIWACTLEINGKTEQWLEEHYKDKWNSQIMDKKSNKTKDIETTIEHTAFDPALNKNRPSKSVHPLFDLSLPVLPPRGLTSVYAASGHIPYTPPHTPYAIFSAAHILLSQAPIGPIVANAHSNSAQCFCRFSTNRNHRRASVASSFSHPSARARHPSSSPASLSLCFSSATFDNFSYSDIPDKRMKSSEFPPKLEGPMGRVFHAHGLWHCFSRFIGVNTNEPTDSGSPRQGSPEIASGEERPVFARLESDEGYIIYMCTLSIELGRNRVLCANDKSISRKRV